MAQFEKGNSIGVQFEETWTFEQAEQAFKKMFDNAQRNPDILCLQDAFLMYPMRGSTFYYLIDKFPSLDKYKKDIQDAIIARINKGAIRGDYNPTACIWRQKQLGERDTQYQNVDQNITTIEMTPEQRKKRIDELKSKLNAD